MPRYSREKMIALAKKTVEGVGGQAAAAEVLGCSQALIAATLTVDPESKRRDGTLVRILEEIGGRTVEIEEVRTFRVEKKK